MRREERYGKMVWENEVYEDQAIKYAASGAGDKITTTVNGEGNQVDNSKNTSQVIADRESTAIGAPIGPQQTTVVEAAPEPTEEEPITTTE